jgi:AcrR family transcriptional regulator
MSESTTTAAAPAPERPGRRDAILGAAARLIARQGVRGMRVEQVAAEAGVSPPLLYYHFESRAGLVRAALEHAGERAPSSALRDPVEGLNGREALERALLAELDDEPAVRDNAVVWGEVSATAVFEEELRNDVRAATESWRDVVCSTIGRGIDDGSIDPGVNAAETAEILITLVDGLCNRWLAGAMTRERARELLDAALLRALGPSPR